MPSTETRGLSALAGFGLLLTAIVCAYLNSTTSVPLWSTIYIAAMVLAALAMAAKWAVALNVQTTAVEYADKVASVVPIASLFFMGRQALHYTHDGLDGFMAGIAIIALVFLIFFGVFDTIASWAGKKFQEASVAISETKQRASAAADALQGRR